MSTALTQLHHHTTVRAGAVARRNPYVVVKEYITMKYYFWCVPWTKKSIRHVYSSTAYRVYFVLITGHDNYNIN